jgi:hypothetical protein
MKIAATNPPTSPTMPPPKAIRNDPRSPPARIISRVSRSTFFMVLCCSPWGRNSAIGGSIRDRTKDEQNVSPHKAQISGEVSTKTRRGRRPAARSMRAKLRSATSSRALYFTRSASSSGTSSCAMSCPAATRSPLSTGMRLTNPATLAVITAS